MSQTSRVLARNGSCSERHFTSPRRSPSTGSESLPPDHGHWQREPPIPQGYDRESVHLRARFVGRRFPLGAPKTALRGRRNRGLVAESGHHGWSSHNGAAGGVHALRRQGARVQNCFADAHSAGAARVDCRRESPLVPYAGILRHPVTGESLKFVAPRGMGKTTLTRMLGRCFGYLTDGTVGIDKTGRIRAYPKRPSLRRQEGGPNTEASPDYLAQAYSARTVKTVILPTRPADRAAPPDIHAIRTLDAIQQFLPESSLLDNLPRTLRTLAALPHQCCPVLSCSDAEEDALVSLTAELIRTAHQARLPANRTDRPIGTRRGVDRPVQGSLRTPWTAGDLSTDGGYDAANDHRPGSRTKGRVLRACPRPRCGRQPRHRCRTHSAGRSASSQP